MTISDIIGRWRYAGRAIATDGTHLYDFTARATIEPVNDADIGADAVRVIIETDQKNSRSVSAPAVPQSLADGSVKLLYDYVADPAHGATASHDFFGMVRLHFAADGASATGNYMNFNGRYTCGEALLERA